MEISSETSKTILNSRDESLHANIRMNEEILEEVDIFKYLRATIVITIYNYNITTIYNQIWYH